MEEHDMTGPIRLPDRRRTRRNSNLPVSRPKTLLSIVLSATSRDPSRQRLGRSRSKTRSPNLHSTAYLFRPVLRHHEHGISASSPSRHHPHAPQTCRRVSALVV